MRCSRCRAAVGGGWGPGAVSAAHGLREKLGFLKGVFDTMKIVTFITLQKLFKNLKFNKLVLLSFVACAPLIFCMSQCMTVVLSKGTWTMAADWPSNHRTSRDKTVYQTWVFRRHFLRSERSKPGTSKRGAHMFITDDKILAFNRKLEIWKPRIHLYLPLSASQIPNI